MPLMRSLFQFDRQLGDLGGGGQRARTRSKLLYRYWCRERDPSGEIGGDRRDLGSRRSHA
jgi:hypothetical protein